MVLHSQIPQLILRRLRRLAGIVAQQGGNQQVVQPVAQQGDKEKEPWQTYSLIVLAASSFIVFIVLLILRLTGHIV